VAGERRRWDLLKTIERIGVPSYVIDRDGRIRWINPAARRIVGDVEGRELGEVVAPEYLRRAREEFARKLVGGAATDFELEIVDAQGRHVLAEISSVPLEEDEHVVGVFGLLRPLKVQARTEPMHALTPRQAQILRLLGDGASTSQIEHELHLSRETVRNHVRHILRALDAHSRLEAVAIARRSGLLD
jgi:PAS domain S-box-containing protein